MNMIIYETEIIPKINHFYNTDIVKSIKAHKYIGHDFIGTPPGTALGRDNLLSIVLYTDYSQLSTNFTATFRRRGIYDTNQNCKIRNAKYYWWSKILWETVNLFGERGWDNELVGPFYTGMSIVMTVPAFNINFYSPTSTSVHIEVALKFSGGQGMIIQTNNKSHASSYFLYGLDCSWISRFRDEDERYHLHLLFYHDLRSFIYPCTHTMNKTGYSMETISQSTSHQ